MSKREEDFKQATQSLEVQVISNPWTLFEKGCEHGYQYAVDKACEWLRNNLHLVRDWPGTPAQNYRELVRMFHKEMQ